MILTEVQRQQLEESAQPLMRWLNENCPPHCSVVVDEVSAELIEGTERVERTYHVDAPGNRAGGVDGAIVHRCDDDDFGADEDEETPI